MKFTYGKGQCVNGASLDSIYEKILNVLKDHQEMLGIQEAGEIVAEWMNDLLFLTGHADLDEVKPIETRRLDEKSNNKSGF